MFMKTVFPGKYIQGEGILDQLTHWVNLLGKNGLILTSRTAREKVLAKYLNDFASNSICLEPFQGECCEKELSRLSRIISDKKVGVLVGMGGGKTIDTAKIAADRAGIPVIGAFIWFVIRTWPPPSSRQALFIGLVMNQTT